METQTLNNDVKVFYVTAASFPDGILEAHQKLHSMIPFTTERRYFGISRPENGGGIVYRAAAEELQPGEAEKLNLHTLVLPKGEYVSLALHDYMKDIASVDRAFKTLLALPGLDPNGYCVEWYTSDKDMICMIRKAD